MSQPTNPLVASPQDDTTAITGIGIAESAADAYNGIADQSWIEAGLGVAGTGLEVLGMVMDPVGSVFAAGVGWLIEHVGPLQEVLDDLAGDPPTIRSYGETWNNVAAELTAIQEDLADAVNSELSGWTGDAADAYREASAGRTEALNGAATVCSGVGLVVTLVGELVAAVREFLRDLIADAVGRLIAWALQVAATLGVGITWVAPQAAAFCAKVAANIADIVRKLLKTLRNVSRRIADLMKSFDDIRGVLQRLARRDGRSPDAADNAPASTSPTASPTTSDSSTSPPTTTSPSSTPTSPDATSPAGSSTTSDGSSTTTPGSDDAETTAPSSPRTGGCFVAGTVVLTVDGCRPVESLLLGDEVITGDPHSGTQMIHPVGAHFRHTVPVVLRLTVQGTQISCSPEHPFWTAASGWRKAADLSAGDVLVGVDGARRPISTITRREGTFTVYNIEVDGLHTYHVSDLHLLVHNKAMQIPRPEGIPKKVDDKYLKRHGVDPHTAKEDLPGAASRFDIYVDRNGNMFGVPKGGKPEDGEYLGNIGDSQG